MKNFIQTNYTSAFDTVKSLKKKHGKTWNGISPANAARMAAQNRFKTGLDIAKYTAAIMRKDMAEYDKDPASYTQSLGCWHGFVAQQKKRMSSVYLLREWGIYHHLEICFVSSLAKSR